ncbi:hypothetical protein ACWEF9_24930 [Streptomyces sp. NPDC004980]
MPMILACISALLVVLIVSVFSRPYCTLIQCPRSSARIATADRVDVHAKIAGARRQMSFSARPGHHQDGTKNLSEGIAGRLADAASPVTAG